MIEAKTILVQSPTPSPGGRLHRRLSSVGVLLLTLSSLSPVFSIYGVGSDVLQHAGSGAVILLILALLAAVVWGVVYAELGSAYPYSGGDYVGVGAILGPWAGAATLAIWAATAGPALAFEAQILSTYVAQFSSGVSPSAITFGALFASVVIALLGVRTGAAVTGVFLAIEMAAVFVLLVAGWGRPTQNLAHIVGHPVALGAMGRLAPVSFGVLALAGVSTVYGVVGGNQAIYFGEELKDPHKRMGRVVLAACLIGAVLTALPIIAVIVGARDLDAVLRSSAPMAVFITQAAGPNIAKILSVGVTLAIFNAMIAQVMYSSRLYFSLGRDAVFNKGLNTLLAGVHPQTGSPRAATVIVGVFSAICCLLSAHILLIFISGLLVYGWSLVCLAVLIGRRKGLTGQAGYWRSPLYPLAPLLGLAMAAVFTLADLADPDAGRPSLLVLGLVAAAALAWCQWGLRRRPGGWTPLLTDPKV